MRRLEPHELTAEEELLSTILKRNHRREIRIPVGPRWGRVILPAKRENRDGRRGERSGSDAQDDCSLRKQRGRHTYRRTLSA